MTYSRTYYEAWLYKKDKKSIKIFSSYDRDSDGEITFGDRNCFPISNVRHMEKIN